MNSTDENNEVDDAQEQEESPEEQAEQEESQEEQEDSSSSSAKTAKVAETKDSTMSDKEVNDWSMYLHFSALVNAIAPPFGYIVPIVMWQIKKDESDVIDQHGKIAANWAISSAIYGAISVALFLSFIFTIVGIPLLGVIWVLNIIFPIMGGLKANKGEIWSYPLSINFFGANKEE